MEECSIGMVLSYFTFLLPFAPRELPRFITTMRALTSTGRPATQSVLSRQISSLNALHLPDILSPTTRYSPAVAFLSCSLQRCRPPVAEPSCCLRFRSDDRSGLRPYLAGSSPYLAETSSLYYGLSIRLQLLSTPPRSDAVTFDYMLNMHAWRGLAPL